MKNIYTFFVVLVIVVSGFTTPLSAAVSTSGFISDYEVKVAKDGVVITLKNLNLEKLHTITVQKCSTGDNFFDLIIKDKEELNSANELFFIDTEPFYGYNYYRIKFEDLEGQIVYTNMKVVKKFDFNSNVSIYPNPSTGQSTFIKFQGCKLDKPVTIYVFKHTGEMIKEVVIEPTVFTSTTIPLDFVSDLKPGIYYFKGNISGVNVQLPLLVSASNF